MPERLTARKLKAGLGREIGNSDWLIVTQERLDGGRGPGLYPGVHFRRTRPWI